MSTILKRSAGVFVAAAIMGGLLAAPAAAGDTPPDTRQCKAALIGKVDANAVVTLNAGKAVKSLVVAQALVNAKLKLCVKLDVDADIKLRVESVLDANGKVVEVKIDALVKAKANGFLDIQVKLIGDTYTSVAGTVVIGARVVAKLDARVAVVADVDVPVEAKLQL